MSYASKPLSIAFGLLAALPWGTPARAEGPVYGLQVSYAMPTGAAFMVTGSNQFGSFLSAGPSAALTAEWGMGPQAAIRTRAEYTSFGDKNSDHAYSEYGGSFLDTLAYDMKMFALGADYLYSFKSNEAGPYVFGGIGYYITSGGGNLRYLEYMPSAPSWEDVLSLDGSGNSMGISLGAGYRLTKNLACELRYTTVTDLSHDVEASFMGEAGEKTAHDIDLKCLQVSLCYRF